MRRFPSKSVVVLGFAILVSFALRVIPPYQAVMTSEGVNFQDNDSWYHIRNIHNIVAHFPRQSGFDPYAVMPSGKNAYTEPWDIFVAAIAWTLTLGKPSEGFVDLVAAWVPAVLGAMLPIPVFFLAKRLFGESTGRWAAIAVAAIPGTLLWETHLGVPDHHVAEGLLSLSALILLCRAAEGEGKNRFWQAAASGVVFGIYLCVRPAGIFVPATLTIAAILEPVLAPLVAIALAATSVVFLFSSGSIWESFTWLTLGSCIAISLLAWGLGVFWRKRAWPRALFVPAIGVAALVAIGIVATLQPTVFSALVERISRYLPGSQRSIQTYSVGELIPIWQVPPGGLFTLFTTLGSVWVPALPVLGIAFVAIWRSRRPVIVLCSVWGLVVIAAGVLQVRMWIYGGPALAIAAGVSCAWLMARVPQHRTAVSLSTAAFLLVTSLPHVIQQSHENSGPRPDWRIALKWLRNNTPEPMGEANAWLRYYPTLKPGQEFAYPPSAYSVITWWDYGDWVNAIGHRIPATNGTQQNAEIVAEFLTATSPEKAQKVAAQLSARYAMLNAEVTARLWGPIVNWAKGDQSKFVRVVYTKGEKGEPVPVSLFLPDYYRSMAVRMFHFNGQAVKASPRISVFRTKILTAAPGLKLDTLISEETFDTEEAALTYMRLNQDKSLTLGGKDPFISCVDLPELTIVRPAFASAEKATPFTVKVFELRW